MAVGEVKVVMPDGYVGRGHAVNSDDAAYDRGFRAGVRQALGETMDADTVGEARKLVLKLLDTT